MNRILLALPLLLTVACTESDECADEISTADLPAAVVEAVEAEWPGAELTGAELEDEGDGEVYEVRFTTEEGEALEAEVTAEGEILEWEADDDDDDDACGEEEDDDDDDDGDEDDGDDD